MTLEHFKLPKDDWYDITNWDYIDKEVYDPSKFTVVGSPTITDDGVMTNESKNDYVQMIDCNKLYNKNWEISCKFTVNRQNITTYHMSPVVTCGSMVYNNFGAINTNGVGDNAFRVSFNIKSVTGTSGEGYHNMISPQFPNGSTIEAKATFNYNTKTYALYYKLIGTHTEWQLAGTKWTCTDTNPNMLATATTGNMLSCGTSRDVAHSLDGTTVDLSKFSITVDGEEVFKGTKTVQEKIPPKGEIVGRLYKEALIENFNAIEAKLNELSGLTAYETQVPDFSNYNYEDVTLNSPNNKVVNLQSFLKIMNLIGVPIECRFTGKLCNKVTYYDKNMRYHTIVNQKLDDLGTDGKVYIILDSSNDTVSAVSDITDLTNKFLLGVYDNGRVYNLRSTGLVDINILTHLCDMSVEPFFIGSLNGTKATEGIYRNGRIIGAWGRESKGAYPKDITLFDIGRQ